MDSNEKEGVCYAQPVTFEDRVAIAKDFVERCLYEVPFAIDPIDNPADELYAGWPERFYIVDEHGVIAYKGETGPFGYHPEEVAAWLMARFPPQVQAPSDVSAERIASEPLSMKAVEYAGSRLRWNMTIDAGVKALVGDASTEAFVAGASASGLAGDVPDGRSFEIPPERMAALRRMLVEERYFEWTEAAGEPRVGGTTRSLEIRLGDSFKIVHAYTLPEDEAPSERPSPAIERFQKVWDLVRGLDG